MTGESCVEAEGDRTRAATVTNGDVCEKRPHVHRDPAGLNLNDLQNRVTGQRAASASLSSLKKELSGAFLMNVT